MTTVKFPYYARLALSLLAIVLVVLILSVGKTIFIPLVFALLVSVLLYPLSAFMENRWRMPRWLASLISLFIFIAGIVGLVYFFVTQAIRFSRDLPHLRERFNKLLIELQSWIDREYHIDAHEQMAYLNESASTIIEKVANSAGNIFIEIFSFVIWMIFVFIFSYFMLSHRNLLYRFSMRLFRPRHTEKVVEVVSETRGMINSYVLGLITEMAILSVLNTIVFGFMGIPYFLLLAVFTAVINIIPYLGVYTGMAIGMIITFAHTSGTLAVQLGIAIIIIHFIDANILLPRIVGRRVKMNPLITIITVLAGHLIWGIPGMFLFIPMVAIFKIISHRVTALEPWSILMGTEEVPTAAKDPLP
jgi:AI-2 transport protein TqsA